MDTLLNEKRKAYNLDTYRDNKGNKMNVKVATIEDMIEVESVLKEIKKTEAQLEEIDWFINVPQNPTKKVEIKVPACVTINDLPAQLHRAFRETFPQNNFELEQILPIREDKELTTIYLGTSVDEANILKTKRFLTFEGRQSLMLVSVPFALKKQKRFGKITIKVEPKCVTPVEHFIQNHTSTVNLTLPIPRLDMDIEN